MQRLFIGSVSLLTACLLACGQQTTYKPHSSGTLALTQDDALLYAVDADNGIVAIIDTATEAKLDQIQVGAMPEQIVLGPDDTAYVANRGDRTVSIFRREAPRDVRTVPVGVEPVGLALSGDGSRLYVVNAASLTDVEHGSLMAINTATLTVEWDLLLPPDPRGIALLSDKRAVVSLYRQGDLVEVNLGTPDVIQVGTGLKEKVNRFDPSIPPALAHKFSPRGMNPLLLSADRDQIYAALTWSSDRVLNAEQANTDPPSGGGSTYGSSSDAQSCTGTAVATSGIATFKANNLEPMVNSLSGCRQAEAPDQPPTRLVGIPGVPLQGPVAMVIDHGGSWMYVALKNSDNVAIVPTATSGRNPIRQQVPLGVGFAPTGLALSSDGRTLYVQSSFRHEIRTLVSSGGPHSKVMARPGEIRFANDVLPADVREGRRLFFSASETQMNDPTNVGIACATCHLEGREDGHVWNFKEGPRQTPSLAGRKMSSTAPFHWGGEHANFAAFVDQTVRARMGGTGLEPEKQAALLAFIDSIPLPDNPHRMATPTAAQMRGAEVFQKAQCSTCHSGEAFTNNSFAHVGTLVLDGDVRDDLVFLSKGLNTPSLLGVARTAPYLHDGSARTLRERIDRGRSLNLHGLTSALTEAEVSDLLEYLRTL